MWTWLRKTLVCDVIVKLALQGTSKRKVARAVENSRIQAQFDQSTQSTALFVMLCLHVEVEQSK